MPGTLFVVATPIGNLEDITVRALRILREVAVIAAEDTRRTAQLLARHAIATPTTSLHEHNEARKSGALVERLLRGDSVALVSDAGTPTVSDPGGGLIRAAIDAGIQVEPIPGASAVMAGLAASGMPTDSFAFLGFPPTRSKDRKHWFERVRAIRGTIVFFEAPHRIQSTLTEIAREFGDCQVAVARELTKVHEEWVRGPIALVSQQVSDPKGEFTIVLSISLTEGDVPSRAPSAAELCAEFSVMTNNSSTTRRKAVSVLARKYGLTPNIVYEMIEVFKKSV
jgi:16S rRNA (cytidine1402-2'-O)-methyltransferase